MWGLGRYKEAVSWCSQAYDYALERNYRQEQQKSCYCLYKSYQAMIMPELALTNYKKYVAMRDSIFGQEMTKEITRMEMNYAFEKVQLADSLRYVAETQLQRARIQHQQIGWASTGVVLLMIGAMAVVVYRGKKRSDHLLLNILPSEIAEELKEYGIAKVKRLEAVTVMFTDFKGFTGIAERLTPEELVGEINTCFSAFDRIMENCGVEKIRTIGDAYMAAGGVPVQNQAHAKDVVKAALHMQRFMTERIKQKQAQGLEYFEMRVGIHTGPVVAGIVGVKKFLYDIWGDTVNIASRMESSGEVGKVNISEVTYELIKDSASFNFTSRGKIEAKGKGEVEMFFAKLT